MPAPKLIRFAINPLSILFLACPLVSMGSSLSETWYNPFFCDIPHTSEDMTMWIKGISSEPGSFREGELLFGEEFDYMLDLDDPQPGTESNDSSAKQYIHMWKRLVLEKLGKLEIPGSQFSVVIIYSSSPDPRKKRLEVKVGEWSSVIYVDHWGYQEKEIPLLEVNVSPYHIDETYKIAGKQYSVYELFDEFIISIAERLNIKPLDVHKHVDLVDSVGSNQELLFRMLVDIENKAWLSQYFGCEHNTGFILKSLVYLSQTDNNRQNNSLLLGQLVEAFNSGPKTADRQSEMSPQEAIQDVSNQWRCGFNMTDYALPADIRIVNTRGYSFPDNDRAKRGEVVNHPVSGTLELRFFPGVQNGDGIRLLNTLVVNWFKYHASQQNDQRPVQYTAYDPLNNDETSKSLQERFSAFLEEIGLTPTPYQIFRRQGCGNPFSDVPADTHPHGEL